jgi:chromate transport protein ChrA
MNKKDLLLIFFVFGLPAIIVSLVYLLYLQRLGASPTAYLTLLGLSLLISTMFIPIAMMLSSGLQNIKTANIDKGTWIFLLFLAGVNIVGWAYIIPGIIGNFSHPFYQGSLPLYEGLGLVGFTTIATVLYRAIKESSYKSEKLKRFKGTRDIRKGWT